jgi:hypothetical protein
MTKLTKNSESAVNFTYTLIFLLLKYQIFEEKSQKLKKTDF